MHFLKSVIETILKVKLVTKWCRNFGQIQNNFLYSFSKEIAIFFAHNPIIKYNITGEIYIQTTWIDFFAVSLHYLITMLKSDSGVNKKT